MNFLRKLFGEKSSEKKSNTTPVHHQTTPVPPKVQTGTNIYTKCSREDYINLPPSDQKKLIAHFLHLVQEKYPNSRFGYTSFPELEYDKMVLSTIFYELKESGMIKTVGYEEFRIIEQNPS